MPGIFSESDGLLTECNHFQKSAFRSIHKCKLIQFDASKCRKVFTENKIHKENPSSLQQADHGTSLHCTLSINQMCTSMTNEQQTHKQWV